MAGEELCIPRERAQELYSDGEVVVKYLQEEINRAKGMNRDTAQFEKDLQRIRVQMRTVRDVVRG